MMRVIFSFIALLFLGPQSALADQPTLKQLDRRLEAASASGFGGAVIVKQNGRVLLARGYGYANRERRSPFTIDTIAQIGSITKTLTGIAIAQLIARGRVDPDMTIGKYVPDAPEPVRSRTIREVLGHRAGLTDACGEDFDHIDAARFLSICLARPLEHPVGEYHYANMGYSVLALVVERASGLSWESYLRKNIWRPIGMTQTGFRSFRRGERSFATGYLGDKPQGVISDRISALGGADWALRGNGGIQASPRDMMRMFDAVLGRRRGLVPGVQSLMLKPVGVADDGVAEGYGLFFRTDETGKLYRVGHSGSDGTFFSYVGWFPQTDVQFYFVGNNGEDQVKPLLRDVLSTVGDLPASR